MAFTIQLSELPGFYEALAKEFPKAVDRGVLSAALRSVAHLRDDSRKRSIFNLGVYARSWKSAPVLDGARVFNSAPYAGIIEEGRRPGRFPPPAPIQAWVRRKLGKNLGAGKRGFEQQVRSVAFLVARKIARDGITGKHVLREAIPTIQRFMQEEVTRELARAAQTGGAP